MENLVYFVGGIVIIIIGAIIGYKIGKRKMFYEMSELIDKERKDAVKKSREVLEGKFSEHLSPILPDFPVEPSEANFLGAPIDFIGFSGKSKGKIEEIVLIEVKSSNSKLTKREKEIKEAIENKRVRFEEYRVPQFKKDLVKE